MDRRAITASETGKSSRLGGGRRDSTVLPAGEWEEGDEEGRRE